MIVDVLGPNSTSKSISKSKLAEIIEKATAIEIQCGLRRYGKKPNKRGWRAWFAKNECSASLPSPKKRFKKRHFTDAFATLVKSSLVEGNKAEAADRLTSLTSKMRRPKTKAATRGEAKNNRYEAKNNRHEARRKRYEARNNRGEARNNRGEAKNNRYEAKNNRHEARDNRHEARRKRYEARNNRGEARIINPGVITVPKVGADPDEFAIDDEIARIWDDAPDDPGLIPAPKMGANPGGSAIYDEVARSWGDASLESKVRPIASLSPLSVQKKAAAQGEAGANPGEAGVNTGAIPVPKMGANPGGSGDEFDFNDQNLDEIIGTQEDAGVDFGKVDEGYQSRENDQILEALRATSNELSSEVRRLTAERNDLKKFREGIPWYRDRLNSVLPGVDEYGKAGAVSATTLPWYRDQLNSALADVVDEYGKADAVSATTLSETFGKTFELPSVDKTQSYRYDEYIDIATRYVSKTELLPRELLLLKNMDLLPSELLRLRQSPNERPSNPNLYYINDGIVDLFMTQLRTQVDPRDHMFVDTSFGSLYKRAEKTETGWTVKDIERLFHESSLQFLSTRFLYFPINYGLHWVLVVADIRNHGLYYVDSFVNEDDRRYQYAQTRSKLVRTVGRFLDAKIEYFHRTKRSRFMSAWSYPESIPRRGTTFKDMGNIHSTNHEQQNGLDCGAFVCAAMLQLSHGAALTISQDRMNSFRKLLLLTAAGREWALGPQLEKMPRV